MAVLSLDQHLCFALYSASRAMTAAYRPVLTEMNLTYPQYLVLLVLWEAAEASDDAGPGGAAGVTVSHLGERLHLDSGTLSPLLKRLEANGFVSRRRSQADERLVEVTLTESGLELQARAQCIPESLFSSTGMTEGDAANLRDAVRQLADALTASSRGPRTTQE
ncbi:MarR family transcriptional regulator [Mycobacterium yunnanensis]|uniref:MarR family transcriptional regulator n=1 Tax=Mycobacterium yunnanensis TaxID=368477 RepID=A0A9X2Z0K7_9MYCO|nr:MarR family transcriptional regulator [Mycobacterium yunnanensis]MCV7421750.1 MarR family transcriptional regulator [Mycobacterium yunnanensis]